MAANPLIRIYNSETGETIDREMTDAEYAEQQALIAKRQAELSAQ
jgi:hypothetical protein